MFTFPKRFGRRPNRFWTNRSNVYSARQKKVGIRRIKAISTISLRTIYFYVQSAISYAILKFYDPRRVLWGEHRCAIRALRRTTARKHNAAECPVAPIALLQSIVVVFFLPFFIFIFFFFVSTLVGPWRFAVVIDARRRRRGGGPRACGCRTPRFTDSYYL